MGLVYKAYDSNLDRYVAIKVLKPHITHLKDFHQRFKIEARNQAKLVHPNIVAVHGFLEYHNLLAIVMEYVEGESIEKIIHKRGGIVPEDAFYIFNQVLTAIGYAHSKGFVHRDIKPSNIILSRDGITKIMDFGLSKSIFQESNVNTNQNAGTIFYMSPEQIQGKEMTIRSDIYSLGCTLYEMISGRPPFFSDNDYEILESHCKKAPPKLFSKVGGIYDWMDVYIQKAMDKNPNNRFSTCEDMASQLFAMRKYKPTTYIKDVQEVVPPKKSGSKFGLLLFLIIPVLIIILAYFILQQHKSMEEKGPDSESGKNSMMRYMK